MSLIPENGHGLPESVPSSIASVERTRRTWQSRLLSICYAIFAFEIGLFLVVFPWMNDTWDTNYFQKVLPALRSIWDDPYFRGAITGLGLMDIYIACVEMFRLLRRP
jgi:hypothetical protein